MVGLKIYFFLKKDFHCCHYHTHEKIINTGEKITDEQKGKNRKFRNLSSIHNHILLIFFQGHRFFSAKIES